jgi:DMSO/TMAO reductase YedYZ molybdopterin-dependent catalytic subunit
VLQWIGGGAVLALGGDLLTACLGNGRETRSTQPVSNPDGALDAGDGAAFPFQPGAGTDGIVAGWEENTVDPQNLAEILAQWTLAVGGMVSRPLTLGFADVLALQRQDQSTDFHCVEGWSVLDVPWNGVKLSRVLDRAGADPAATYLTFGSAGGIYSESLPVSVAREERTLLGYGVGGSTLPLAHGFPLRLVVPRLLGYKNAKYLTRIEVTDQPMTGYWEALGYPYAGEVPAERLRPGKY